MFYMEGNVGSERRGEGKKKGVNGTTTRKKGQERDMEKGETEKMVNK